MGLAVADVVGVDLHMDSADGSLVGKGAHSCCIAVPGRLDLTDNSLVAPDIDSRQVAFAQDEVEAGQPSTDQPYLVAAAAAAEYPDTAPVQRSSAPGRTVAPTVCVDRLAAGSHSEEDAPCSLAAGRASARTEGLGCTGRPAHGASSVAHRARLR